MNIEEMRWDGSGWINLARDGTMKNSDSQRKWVNYWVGEKLSDAEGGICCVSLCSV